MNLRSWTFLAALSAAPLLSRGQPVTITSADMFNQAGQYYLAFANDFDPTNPTNSYPCSHLMGTTGGPQLWDFSHGPTNQIFRYDYLAPGSLPGASSFPKAKVAEQKSVSGTGHGVNQTNWLYFEQVTNVGRKVYGFYDETFSSTTPDNVFDPAIVDFPSSISYNDTWTTSFTITTTIDVPEFDVSFPAQMTFSSTFVVDAYGTIDLPQLSFGPVLRVNEAETIATSADVDGSGTYSPLETDYVRTYYWLSPSHGIAAQLSSIQASSPPPNDFDQATAFVRMFETNHKTVTAPTGPFAVTDLRVSVNGGQVLLKWTAPPATRQYRVEYTTGSFEPSAWKPLVTLTNQVYTLEPVGTNKTRFYRIVSLQ